MQAQLDKLTAVSTHSRLKAAGGRFRQSRPINRVSTHSRLKAAGAQRRQKTHRRPVSTHSRLKAAGNQANLLNRQAFGFNTQPPEGGWHFF